MTVINAQTADITLLLEGTYPFVKGGVSSWVHQIIQGLPEFTFSLIFLGSTYSNYDKAKYTLPNNVVSLHCHYLIESWQVDKPKACSGNAEYFADSARLHDFFHNPSHRMNEGLLRQVVLIGLVFPIYIAFFFG